MEVLLSIGILAFFLQQIHNIFVVDFNEASPDDIFAILSGLDCLNHMVEGPGDDALDLWVLIVAHHGEGFACASLPIGKNSAIVPL